MTASSAGEESVLSESTGKVDAIFRSLVSPGSPGLAVGVIYGGELRFSRGYGLADLEKKTTIAPGSNFRLASVTKQFTAMAVMLLVHDGKLHYDDPLTKVFPDFPAYGRSITIRHLLTHTSGLKDYEDIYLAPYRDTPPAGIPQIHDAQVLKLMEQQSAGDFPPGSRWRYSNSGYSVLAMVVERVSGRSSPDFLRERIFEPLGMAHTLAYVKGLNEVPNRVFGYRRGKSSPDWDFADQSSTSAVLGDGGVYSSIEDLARWDRALRGHTLLSAAEMRPALEPTRAPGVEGPDGTPAAYGFGWFLDPYQGHRRMWHYGETSGFLTAIERFPEEDLTVIVLANRTDVSPQALALRVADVYLTRQQPAPQNPAPPAPR